MSSSSAIVKAQQNTGSRPDTQNSTASSISALPPPSLLCNLCQKPLTTTCYLCACDCIFCEECTYSHFEHNSGCPTCGKTLCENDFTELVVAQANGSNDITKSSLQALFSKQSKSPSVSKALPLSDICFSLVRQIDVMKKSTKFLLKQLLMDSSSANRRNMLLRRQMENMKLEVTQIKQHHSSQRLQYEQMNNDLRQKLSARESTNSELYAKIKEQQKMINQFQKLHDSRTQGMETDRSEERISHCVPPSTVNGLMKNHMYSQNSINYSNSHQEQNCSRQKPPLKGYIIQKEAKQAAQHAYNNAIRNPIRQNRPEGYLNPTQSPYISRPYSSTSSGSHASNIPRIRELSSSAGFHFKGASSSQQHQNKHLNKRRKTTPGTRSSYLMSPNTAFTLNQGPHTIRHHRQV